MRIFLISTLLATVAASGCASMNEKAAAEVAALDYGAPIGQADAETQANVFMTGYLKDPYSAMTQYRGVYPGWVREPYLNGGALHYGYILDAAINAKNSFGGYVGARGYKFIFSNGRLITVLEEQPGPYFRPVAKLGTNSPSPPKAEISGAPTLSLTAPDAGFNLATGKTPASACGGERNRPAIGWSLEKLKSCSDELQFVSDVGAGNMKSSVYSACEGSSCRSITIENGVVSKID